MLYKKIYIYVNVRIVTISLLCLTTGVVHQIFTQFREIDRLSLYISFFLSLSLLLSLFIPFSPLYHSFSPLYHLFFPHVLGRIPLSSPPRVWVMCIYD